jgi:integrase
MASIFKPKGSDKYVIVYRDENGKRRWKRGTRDKAVTERISRGLENKVALRKEGLIDPKDEAYVAHGAEPLLTHIDTWIKEIRSRGTTAQHVKMHSSRAMRVIALIKGASLEQIEAPKPATRVGVKKALDELRSFVALGRVDDLTAGNVQGALDKLIREGRSLQTANHHRNSIKSFAKWLNETGRMRQYTLARVAEYNVKKDLRHERRTISLDELQKLINAAQAGKPFKSMTGPMRALCYRLAVASGLRYSELASIKPESFDWTGSTVTIHAAYAKNGETIALPINAEVAADLRAYVATLPSGRPIFPLPHDKGAAMVRRDLEAAGIQYRDSAGLVFDFHSLRCELATLADAAGVSPRVVQRLMRHSKLEMTQKYTRPRPVDLEAAAMKVPSLKPSEAKPEALAATGTDGRAAKNQGASAVTGEEIHMRRNTIPIIALDQES